MRPCLNPGQMNPPGGMHSPAAWITPSHPYLTQTLQSSVCRPTHPYFPRCLPLHLTHKSPLKLRPSSCSVAHISRSFCSNVCMSERLVTGVFESRRRLEADLWPGHHYSVKYKVNFTTHLLHSCVCAPRMVLFPEFWLFSHTRKTCRI